MRPVACRAFFNAFLPVGHDGIAVNGRRGDRKCLVVVMVGITAAAAVVIVAMASLGLVVAFQDLGSRLGGSSNAVSSISMLGRRRDTGWCWRS